MSDTVVFIPAWNEEENLPAVLGQSRVDRVSKALLPIGEQMSSGNAGQILIH